jgi:hypothetical protein
MSTEKYVSMNKILSKRKVSKSEPDEPDVTTWDDPEWKTALDAIEGGGDVITATDIVPVRADIIGSDMSKAEGHIASGSSPLLKLCRLLVRVGFDPYRPLSAYRGTMLCLTVRSIGEGAALTVKERPFGPVFEAWEAFPTPPLQPPMRQKRLAATLTTVDECLPNRGGVRAGIKLGTVPKGETGLKKKYRTSHRSKRSKVLHRLEARSP